MNPINNRLGRSLRVALAVLGGAVSVVAICRDWIALGAPVPGFGGDQILLLGAGVSAVAGAIAVPDRIFLNWAVRPLLSGGIAYVGLVLCDLGLYAKVAARHRPPAASLQGLFRRDDLAGYTLTPNFHGYYDDGAVVAEYRTNSWGDRDDEPRFTDGARVLLIGDSFAFGTRLNQVERIDLQVEHISRGRIDAYDLGVPGYGPPSIVEHFRARDWLRGSDVVYVFCNNDLTNWNLDPGHWTVLDGFVVPRSRSDGSAISKEECRARIEQSRHPSLIKPVLKLRHLWTMAAVWWGRVTNSEAQLLDPAELGPENVPTAVSYTRRMQVLSAERGMRFHVLIVPGLEEILQRRHAPVVAEYIARLRGSGIHVVDLLDRLSSDDYFLDEGHFNPIGARHAAAAVVECVTSG